MDYSERLMRNAIRALPDGDYAAETTIDGFLDDPEAKRRDLKIKATLKVRGDEITVDLTGTAPQVDDRPINMPLEGTVDCAIWLTLRSILLDSVIYGNVPQNGGLTRPIHIVAPKGTLANPNFPAPVIARFCPGNALADTVMIALSQCVPGQVSAGIGNLRCVAFTGLYEGRHWVQMEILEGSYGGREGMDGMDAVDTLYANTRNNPIEDVESHLPIRVNRYELRNQAPAQANGAAASARSANSPSCRTAPSRSRARAISTGPGVSAAAPKARPPRSGCCRRRAARPLCRRRRPITRQARATGCWRSAPTAAATAIRSSATPRRC